MVYSDTNLEFQLHLIPAPAVCSESLQCGFEIPFVKFRITQKERGQIAYSKPVSRISIDVQLTYTKIDCIKYVS